GIVHSKRLMAEQGRDLHLPVGALEALSRVAQIVRDDDRAPRWDNGKRLGQRSVVDEFMAALRIAEQSHRIACGDRGDRDRRQRESEEEDDASATPERTPAPAREGQGEGMQQDWRRVEDLQPVVIVTAAAFAHVDNARRVHDEERSDSEQQNGCASLFWIVDSCGQDNDRRQGQPQDIGHEAGDATAAAYVVQLIQRKQLQPKVWRNRREDPKHQVGRDEYHPDGEQLWRGLKRLRGNGLPRLRENEP